MLGGTATGTNAVAFGFGARATADDSVAIGSGSAAGAPDTVSVGSADRRRRITNVATPVDGTDAANKDYVDSIVHGSSSAIDKLDRRLSKKINQLGATSSAMAALHPMGFDENHRLSMAAGVGAYGDEAAGAIGVFYKATDDLMLSVSGGVGTGNVMGNLGIAWRFGGDLGPRKAPSGKDAAARVGTPRDGGDDLAVRLRLSEAREARLAKQLAALQERMDRLDAASRRK